LLVPFFEGTFERKYNMKKQIDIHGLSTTSLYKDGEYLSLVNLRKKNGVLKPVTPRKVVNTLEDIYSYLFQHNLPQSDVPNLLGVRDGHVYLIGVTEPFTTVELTEVDEFKSMTQLGNLVNVLDKNGLKTLFWQNGAYNVYDIAFGGSQTDSLLGPVKVDLKVDGRNENGVRRVDYFESDSVVYGQVDYADWSLKVHVAERKNFAIGMFAKALSETKNLGYIHGYILACTAIELFDGSYILQSNPVLLGSAFVKDGYFNVNSNGVVLSWDSPEGRNPIFIPNYDNNTPDGNYMDSMNVYDFDHQTPETYSPYPNLFAYANNYYSAGRMSAGKMVSYISSNELKFKVNTNIDENYRNLIKSVSVFISSEISMYKMDSPDNTIERWNTTSTTYPENFFPKYKDNSDIIKEISNNQQFYKVHEIAFDDIKTTTENDGWVTIDLKGKLGENLKNQEPLPVDNFTHHDMVPNGQFVYNNKLHVWDYKQELFHGWPLNYFYANQGVGQFPAIHVHNAYNRQCWVRVKIKTETGISEVVRIMSGTSDEDMYSTNGILSYPDSRATEMTIYEKYQYETSGGGTIHNYTVVAQKTFKLTASDDQNFAYYIAPDLKPIALDSIATEIAAPTELNRTQIYRNGLKVSQVNNPFYYPADQTHTVGTGIIRNVATNAMRMSDGQFGQYPLYVFTTEGEYSFDTGTTIAYNRQSPASMVVAVSDIVCPTPYGVVFVGKRGVYLIQGQTVEYLSAQLEQLSPALNIGANQVNFWEFITTLKEILYDSLQNELIFVNDTNRNFVFNIDAKMWYRSTEKIDYAVQNTSPELMVSAQKEIVHTSDDIKVPAYSIPAYWSEINAEVGDIFPLIGVDCVVAKILEAGDVGYEAGIRKAYIMGATLSPGTWSDAVAYNFMGLIVPNSLVIGKIVQGGLSFPTTGSYWSVSSHLTNGISWSCDSNSLQETNKSTLLPYFSYAVVQNPKQWVAQVDVPAVYYEDGEIEIVETLKDFSQQESNAVAVELITRPMYNETDEQKHLQRMILRGLYFGMNTDNSESKPFISLYGSNDGLNCIMLRGFAMPDGNDKQGRDYKDFDLGLMAQTAFRTYVLAYSAELEADSQIDGIDMEVSVNYKNEKMR